MVANNFGTEFGPTCTGREAVRLFLPREQTVTDPMRTNRVSLGLQCLLDGYDGIVATFTMKATGKTYWDIGETWVREEFAGGVIDGKFKLQDGSRTFEFDRRFAAPTDGVRHGGRNVRAFSTELVKRRAEGHKTR